MTPTTPVIDAHVHVWRAVEDAPNPAATIVSPVCDVPASTLCEHLDEHGVARAVVVQPLCAGVDNSLVAALAREQPDRFAAVCAVDPRAPDVDAALERWAATGCRGVRLRPYALAGEAPVDAPGLRPFWAAASRLGLVVSLLASPDDLPSIDAVAGAHPELRLVIDHLAHVHPSAPGPAAPLVALARHARVYVKLSGYHHLTREPYPYPRAVELVRAVHGAFGAGRLLWGSDFPHVLLRCGYARSVALPGRAFDFLTAGELDAVMGGTAAALYFSGTTP